jgi:cobaltochelatase CobS
MVAEAMGLAFYERSMGMATSEWDLLGFRNADGDYVPGLLREPYENGGVLMLDEIDNSNPSVLTTLNSALESGMCTFPDGAVARHPDFICIAGGNTYGTGPDRMYCGRTQLDAATLDRFANLDWDYDEEAELDWAGRDQIAWTRYVQTVRRHAMENSMRVVVGPRASIKGAVALRAGIDPAIVVKSFLWKGMSGDDVARLSMLSGPYIPAM